MNSLKVESLLFHKERENQMELDQIEKKTSSVITGDENSNVSPPECI